MPAELKDETDDAVVADDSEEESEEDDDKEEDELDAVVDCEDIDDSLELDDAMLEAVVVEELLELE